MAAKQDGGDDVAASVPRGYVRRVTELLERHLVRDLVGAARPVHELRPDQTLHEALELFAEHGIQSAPVRAADARDVAGFVDALDVLALVLVEAWNTDGPASGGSDDGGRGVRLAPDRAELEATGQLLLASKRVRALVNRSGADPLFMLGHGANLYQAVECVFSRGARRAAVTDDDGQLVGVLSQSDVANFLALHLGDLDGDPLLAHTVRELGLVRAREGGLVSVRDTDPAAAGFAAMLHAGVSALPVLNAAGDVVAELSATALRGLALRGFGALCLPVAEYLLRARLDAASLPRPPLVVAETATFRDAVTELGLYRGHRLWVCEPGTRRPAGVVSLTNVMRFLGE